MKIDYHSLHEKGRKTTNNYKNNRIFTQKWDLAGVFYRVFVRAHTYCIWWQVIAQQMYRFIIINTACVSQHKLIRNVMNGCNCCHFNSLSSLHSKNREKKFEKSFGSLHFIWFERNMHSDRMMRLPELVFIVEKQNAEKQ